MTAAPNSLLLTDLTPAEVEDYLKRDQRLIVPVGACDQYGPHLPFGTSTLIAEAFATSLSHDFNVLRAAAVPYGVNVGSDRAFAGATSLREMTLHSLLNDLLAGWEDDGFTEFILLTIHDYDSHVEAMATVTLAQARVRAIELVNIDLSTILESAPGPQHGGETVTSLMLHLYPEKVKMEQAVDFVPTDRIVSTLRRLPRIPADSPGSLGQPTLASADKGRRLYEHIYEKIRTRVFVDVEE